METGQSQEAMAAPFSHGSYLQGMETIFHSRIRLSYQSRTDPTYKEWKPVDSFVRHVGTGSTDPTYKEWKHIFPRLGPHSINRARILPTRNGNGGFLLCAYPMFLCTDPTYKEWKRHEKSHYCCGICCTDPTYKEWKLRLKSLTAFRTSCTDPTYKEWKLC